MGIPRSGTPTTMGFYLPTHKSSSVSPDRSVGFVGVRPFHHIPKADLEVVGALRTQSLLSIPGDLVWWGPISLS